MKSQELYLGGRENGWGRILVELLKIESTTTASIDQEYLVCFSFFFKMKRNMSFLCRGVLVRDFKLYSKKIPGYR